MDWPTVEAVLTAASKTRAPWGATISVASGESTNWVAYKMLVNWWWVGGLWIYLFYPLFLYKFFMVESFWIWCGWSSPDSEIHKGDVCVRYGYLYQQKGKEDIHLFQSACGNLFWWCSGGMFSWKWMGELLRISLAIGSWTWRVGLLHCWNMNSFKGSWCISFLLFVRSLLWSWFSVGS